MTAALETLRSHYRERDRAARAWKDSGGRVVGYLCDNVPEELIMAAAVDVPASPVRLPGEAIVDPLSLERGDTVPLLHPTLGPRPEYPRQWAARAFWERARGVRSTGAFARSAQ